MKKIIVNYAPFVVQQTILVFGENGETINNFSVDLDKVNDTVKTLCKQYNISEVYLVGNENYLKRFQTKMKNTFENDSVCINIVKK